MPEWWIVFIAWLLHMEFVDRQEAPDARAYNDDDEWVIYDDTF